MAKIFKKSFQRLSRNIAVVRLLALGMIFILAASLVLSIRGDARSNNGPKPISAVIQTYEKNISSNSKKLFQIVSGRGSSSKVPVAENASIGQGGSLSVPTDGKAWAQLYFLEDEKNRKKAYGGLVVRTLVDPQSNSLRLNSYQFPCEFRGAYIIALRPGRKACGSSPDGGIRIITKDPKRIITRAQNFNDSHSPIKMAGLLNSIGLFPTFFDSEWMALLENKNSSRLRPIQFRKSEIALADIETDLVINPGQERTVIKTNVDGTAETSIDVPECTEIPSESKTIVSGSQKQLAPPVRLQCLKKPIKISSDVVSIEVLEGDVLVKVPGNTVEQTVRRGQKYVYPQKEVTTIDASKEANTCEMLRFFNAAYWYSPETPKEISDDIAKQLQKHREALGVSGLRPSSTQFSPLEQKIFNIMNRERDSKALPPLNISKGMSSANRDHVRDQEGSNKYFGHAGGQSISTGARLRRYGSVGCANYNEDQFENIIDFEQSPAPDAQAIVNKMLSNGSPQETGMKDNLFNKDFQVTGVACGSKMCVVTYAEGYLEKDIWKRISRNQSSFSNRNQRLNPRQKRL